MMKNIIKLPTYHRQRFLLQFIEGAGGNMSKMDLQKLLFLAHRRVNVSYYDFVPYHYGCYSFQVASDIKSLQKGGWIYTSSHNIYLKKSINRYEFVKHGEKAEIRKFFDGYRKLRGNALLNYIYKRFPYYATNSKIAHRISRTTSPNRLSGNSETLYTLGYEGMTFESYVNTLIQNNVNVLCDVRKNPLSRKFGFSKRTMSSILPQLKIKYLHIPELGILSEDRKNLHLRSDYIELFKEYEKTLPLKENHIKTIQEHVADNKNVALTCFEHQPNLCHRSHISSYIEKKYCLNVIHL